MRAAIDVLAQLPGPHLLVLGDMGEVGTQGPEFHAEVGRYARERGIEHVLTTGQWAEISAQAHGQAQHHPQMDSLCKAVAQRSPQVSSILVKGSRFMRMERVVQHLMSGLTQEQALC